MTQVDTYDYNCHPCIFCTLIPPRCATKLHMLRPRKAKGSWSAPCLLSICYACQLIECPGNRLQSFYVIDASQLRHPRNVATLRLAEIVLVIHTLPLLLVLNVWWRSFLNFNLHNLTFREYYGAEILPWIRIEKATTHITICVLICYCTYDGTGISTSLGNVLEPLSFTVKQALKGTEYSCNCF